MNTTSIKKIYADHPIRFESGGYVVTGPGVAQGWYDTLGQAVGARAEAIVMSLGGNPDAIAECAAEARELHGAGRPWRLAALIKNWGLS